ncbi:MAG: hypothetical protein N4A50_07670 [Vallitalea sp.]|jgi:hypothetical protein|nr:hypothetical protein [Vallitalea sp.]
MNKLWGGISIKENVVEILKERWKFYIIGYIFGYVFPLLHDGIPNNLYLIPIKVTGIIFAISIGTALYYGSIHMPVFEGYRRAFKYVVATVIIMIFSYILTKYLNKFGIDITPLIGINFLK